MVTDVTQSPEAALDREIEKLIGDMLRNTLTAEDAVRLGELQRQRSKLLRPSPPTPPKASFSLHNRRFA